TYLWIVHEAEVHVDEILNVQQVPDLLARPEDRQRLSESDGHREPGHPSLILDPDLAGPIDAGLTKRDRAHAVDARIVGRVRVCRALRTSVWRARVERLRLGDARGGIAIDVASLGFVDDVVRELPVDLVRR